VCVIERASREAVALRALRREDCQAENNVSVTLFSAVPKDGLDNIVRKAVELGASGVVPVVTEFTVRRDFSGKLARLRKISESAACQSGRGIIPEIEGIIGFDEAARRLAAMPGAIVAYEAERTTRVHDALSGFRGSAVGVFIGPEGGFSDGEIRALSAAGVVPVTLGRRVLRVETAVVCAVSVINYELGEF
jgi:16S rRNA (uracil1498-N3)-methyltransferase